MVHYVKGYYHIWFITRLFQIFSGTVYRASREAKFLGSLESLSHCTPRKKIPHQRADFSAKAVLQGHVTQDEMSKRAAPTRQHGVFMRKGLKLAHVMQHEITNRSIKYKNEPHCVKIPTF